MPRAVLMFRLPQEQTEFNMALTGTEWQGVLWLVDQHLRNRIKHEELSDSVSNALQLVRDMIREEMLARAIGFDL